jgi:hypothetical protein
LPSIGADLGRASQVPPSPCSNALMRELGLTLTWMMVAALCFKSGLGIRSLGRGGRTGRLLIEAEDVPGGIAKAGGDLGTPRIDRLLDLSAVLNHRGESRGDTIDHDVDQHARGCRGRPASDPRATHLANTVIEGERTVASPSSSPPDNCLVEGG